MPPWLDKALGLWGFGGSSGGLCAKGVEEPRAGAGETVAVRCSACDLAEARVPAIATIVPLGKVCLCRPWIDQLTHRTLMCNGAHSECAR